MAFCVIDLPNFWGPTQKIPNSGGAQKIGGRAPIGPPCPLSWQHSTRPLKMAPLAPPRVIIYSAHMAFCDPPPPGLTHKMMVGSRRMHDTCLGKGCGVPCPMKRGGIFRH